MSIRVAGLHNFKPRGPLNPDWYRLRITDAKKTAETRMKVKFMVNEGPTQEDDSDPQGRTFSVFVTTGGFEKHKDDGEFAMGILASLLSAAGVEVDEDDNFDEDGLIDQEVLGWVFNKPNYRTGLPEEDSNVFRPVEE